MMHLTVMRRAQGNMLLLSGIGARRRIRTRHTLGGTLFGCVGQDRADLLQVMRSARCACSRRAASLTALAIGRQRAEVSESRSAR